MPRWIFTGIKTVGNKSVLLNNWHGSIVGKTIFPSTSYGRACKMLRFSLCGYRSPVSDKVDIFTKTSIV